MKKISNYFVFASLILFITSFFLPSRLTNMQFSLILEFANSNQIGFSVYILILYPIILILHFIIKTKLPLAISTAFIIMNTGLFEESMMLIFSDLKFWGNYFPFYVLPTIILFVVSFWLMDKSLNNKHWYFLYLGFILITYFYVNDYNCMIEFHDDMGVRVNNLLVWFDNCGTYYAWWTSGIFLNVGIWTNWHYQQKVITNN